MKNSKVLTVLWVLFILTLLVLSKTISMGSDAGNNQSNRLGENIAKSEAQK